MQIKKQSGILEDSTPHKITETMEKAFVTAGGTRNEPAAAGLLKVVEDSGLEECLAEIQREFDPSLYSLHTLSVRLSGFIKPGMEMEERIAALTKAAIELTSPEAPDWEKIAARFLNYGFRCRLAVELNRLEISCFYEKIVYLTKEGLYGDYILNSYSREDLELAASFIEDSRDQQFTWSGLDLLLKRYVIQTRQHEPLETPQEMFLGIALHLAMNETADRMKWVRKFYDMLSLQQVTMATPTLSNARKPYHQLSSCFIDMVPDSLEGIYRSIDNFARVSKFGGGMGLYFGKVRATLCPGPPPVV